MQLTALWSLLYRWYYLVSIQMSIPITKHSNGFEICTSDQCWLQLTHTVERSSSPTLFLVFSVEPLAFNVWGLTLERVYGWNRPPLYTIYIIGCCTLTNRRNFNRNARDKDEMNLAGQLRILMLQLMDYSPSLKGVVNRKRRMTQYCSRISEEGW